MFSSKSRWAAWLDQVRIETAFPPGGAWQNFWQVQSSTFFDIEYSCLRLLELDGAETQLSHGKSSSSQNHIKSEYQTMNDASNVPIR